MSNLFTEWEETSKIIGTSLLRMREAILTEMVKRFIGPSAPQSAGDCVTVAWSLGADFLIVDDRPNEKMECRLSINGDVVEVVPLPTFRDIIRCSIHKAYQPFAPT